MNLRDSIMICIVLINYFLVMFIGTVNNMNVLCKIMVILILFLFRVYSTGAVLLNMGYRSRVI